ncbi:MAG: T9SS type A sorting domain-containing protein, partial [Cyclobacteriaceae bacterium]|nr:T9SS type A sorting domain-containing protein [Cyclobacteriaceae bacterium]
ATWYYYLTGNVSPTAVLGSTTQVQQPVVENFGYLDPKVKIDGGLLAGPLLTIESSDQLAPVSSMDIIKTNDRTPPLTGLTNDVTATIQVTIDNLTYTATVFPTGLWSIADNTILSLADGFYDVTLLSTDSVFNFTETIVPNAVYIDATPAQVDFVPVSTNDNTPPLTGWVDDNQALIKISIGTNNYTATTINDSTWQVADNTIQPLTEGYHDITVLTTDSLGNTLSVLLANALFIDSKGPVVTIEEAVSINPQPTIRGTVSDSTATLTVTLNGVNYTSLTRSGTNWQLAGSQLPVLADGGYDIVAIAVDSLGNEGRDTTTNELVINTTNLLVRVDPLTTNDVTPDLKGRISSPDATVAIQLAGKNYFAQNKLDGTWFLSGSLISPPLVAGIYNVGATATDGLGHTGQDSTTNELRIDIRPPLIRIKELETYDPTPKITGLVDDLKASITLEINGKIYPATNKGDSTWEVADNVVDYLPVGLHQAVARAKDVAGNIGVDNGEIRILPSPVVALPASNVTTSGFAANWRSAPGVTTYLLTVSLERNAREKLITKDVPVADTSYQVTGRYYSQMHYYRVRAVYASGDTSAYSNIVGVRTQFDLNTAKDSLALVSIYTNTKGSGWKNRGNWLQGKLYEWAGVTMQGTRVTAVNLSSNNLTGAIPSITSGLEMVTTLNFSGNELTKIGSLGNMSNLVTLDARNNRLVFSELMTIAAGGTYQFNYSPQKEVLLPVRALAQLSDVYVVDRTVNGGDAYTWFKNGIAIQETTSSFSITVLDYADEGVFHAEVTSTSLPGLTLLTTPVTLRVSSLQRDSTALIAIYDAVVTAGSTVDNWKSKPLSQWNEITIANNRVTQLNLAGKAVEGVMPVDLLDIGSLTTLDLSGNQLTWVPALTSLTSLLNVNLASNQLDFSSIEPNVNVPGIDFSNQALLGIAKNDTIPRGDDYVVGITTRGDAITYNWYHDGQLLVGENNDFYVIRDIDINSMGSYHVEVSSTQVPGFALTSHTQQVLAVADIEYFPGFSYADGVRGFLQEGEGKLFKIVPHGPYDTVAIVPVHKKAVLFEDIVLGDYLLLVDTRDDYMQTKEFNYTADSISIDTVIFIPTYYESSLEWDSANVLQLRDYISDTLQMLRIPPPLTPFDGDGIISMLVESNFADGTAGGRVESRRRVKKAGCSLRRRTTGTGGRPEEEAWELIAYKETDDNGEVNFGYLPIGFYRLNIQYPGVPMDPTSFVAFEISADEEQDGYELAATVTEEGIYVEVVEELGFLREYFKDLIIYPNPASNVLNINYGKLFSADVEYQLSDMNGRIVRHSKVPKGHYQQVEVDVADLESGIYVLHFYDSSVNKKHLATYKIIIRRF